LIRLFRKKKKAIIVFSSDYQLGLSTYGDHQTFDIYKYQRIRNKLIEDKLLKPKEIFQPTACTYAEIGKIHSTRYITQLKDPLSVNRLLKIQVNSIFDNSVLEYYRAVCGGTIKAFFAAYRYGVPVFNLGGGFHHAYPEKAEGFCLLNDTAIAVKALRGARPVQRILVIDLDYHQGNGTRYIFRDDPAVFTYSVHATLWNDEPAIANMDRTVNSDITDKDYNATVAEDIHDVLDKFEPEFVVYIAGSDPYEKDTLGDMKLSREGLFKRNMFIAKLCEEHKWPLVVLAGGGYGPDSWQIYYDFIAAALK